MLKKLIWVINFVACMLLVNIASADDRIDTTQQNQSIVNFFWQSQNAAEFYNVQIDTTKNVEANFEIQVNNMPFMPGITLSAVEVQWVSAGQSKNKVVQPGEIFTFHAADYVLISSIDDNPAEGVLTYLGAITVG